MSPEIVLPVTGDVSIKALGPARLQGAFCRLKLGRAAAPWSPLADLLAVGSHAIAQKTASIWGSVLEDNQLP